MPYLKTDKIKRFIKNNIGSIIFLLILFNASKALVLPFNYLRGVLIDYTILKIFISQIVLILILGFYVKEVLSNKLTYIFLFVILINLFFSLNPFFTLVYAFQAFLIYLIPVVFKKSEISIKIIILVNILYIIIFLVQFITDKSFFNYFPMGFYPYYGISPNVDFFSFFGVVKVIPMANFPHANVFAGFISFTNILLLKNKKYLIFLINLVLLIVLSSFSALLFNFVFILYLILKANYNATRKFAYLLISFLISLMVLYIFYTYGFKNVSVFQRLNQLEIFWYLITNFSLFGVGLNNYVFAINIYENVRQSIFVLQPVHNIFILILVEGGLFMFTFLFYLLFNYKKYLKVTPYLLFVVILGLFDHYLVTLNQGMLILALTILLHNSIINNSND